jgi:DNA-binding MarR family transcriptional regulator
MKLQRMPLPDLEEPLLLSAAYLILRKQAERAVAPWNLTLTQAFTLAMLDDLKYPVTISKLARLLIQESPSTSTLVERMYERGLVDRTGDPKDRRKALVKLTDAGKALLKEVRSPMQAAADELFAALSKEQRKALKEALNSFRDANLHRMK